ncbi:tyrosine-type recombinase/integrase [Streptomyces sp. NPDC059003]|uniref:tyrosine-type recombinase/integrase n=1 Tax=Streptomyces sp. NPDC059003 TaxID=3346691 RepID=UPI0036884A89
MPETTTSLPATGRTRRHEYADKELSFPSRFISGSLEAAPAVAATLPRPHGDLSTASAQTIAEVVRDIGQMSANTRSKRVQVTRTMLDYLGDFPGATWQERWDACPIAPGGVNSSDLSQELGYGRDLNTGLRSLICLRVIQPSLRAFRSQTFPSFAIPFHEAQNDPLLDAFHDRVQAHDMSWQHKRNALNDICALLAVQGVSLSDVTPAAMLHHGHESRRAAVALGLGEARKVVFPGIGAWNVLHAMGHFPPDTPTTLRAALTRGQLSVEDLIDRYPIRNQGIRQLLIDYCSRRMVETDYATLSHICYLLGSMFWRKVEQINPDQADLRLTPETYAAWRQAITIRDDGKPRRQQDDIIITVRSLYLDLHTWAAQEPERWAHWVVPCPIPPGELRGVGKRRRRHDERTADRTRQRQPLLPVLAEHVENRYDHARRLLEQATSTPDGIRFVLDGTSYRRTVTESDRKIARHETPPVKVTDEATGRLIHITTDEETAFWDWASIEVLRHSGIRIEEMCELSHLSIRQYQRPSGEVVGLLVIAPSKTDRERVIPMSPELFHVIACLIRRHTRDGQPIPLVSRYDPHDKLWSTPLPFLFQRRIGANRGVIGTNTVLNMIRRRCESLGETHPGFRDLHFTPHDFRRIFATELVNSGLPIHIGAALLGHLNIQTTRGYVAVFDEDVIRHYVTHLDNRRKIRPSDEYRPASTEEWDEFTEHFDKRKVELGSCGRPYGTPCQHEHACIRCPMLHVNPKMLARLDELEKDLLARRVRAEREGWAGEIEGLNLTLALLHSKRDESQRMARRPAVDLGIPARRRPKESE